MEQPVPPGLCPQAGRSAPTPLPCRSRSGETRWPLEGVRALTWAFAAFVGMAELTPFGTDPAARPTCLHLSLRGASAELPPCGLLWAVVTGRRWSRPGTALPASSRGGGSRPAHSVRCFFSPHFRDPGNTSWWEFSEETSM